MIYCLWMSFNILPLFITLCKSVSTIFTHAIRYIMQDYQTGLENIVIFAKISKISKISDIFDFFDIFDTYIKHLHIHC